jgi:hypothetical protein
MALQQSSYQFREEESDVTDLIHRPTLLHKMTAKRRASTVVITKAASPLS